MKLCYYFGYTLLINFPESPETLKYRLKPLHEPAALLLLFLLCCPDVMGGGPVLNPQKSNS